MKHSYSYSNEKINHSNLFCLYDIIDQKQTKRRINHSFNIYPNFIKGGLQETVFIKHNQVQIMKNSPKEKQIAFNIFEKQESINKNFLNNSQAFDNKVDNQLSKYNKEENIQSNITVKDENKGKNKYPTKNLCKNCSKSQSKGNSKGSSNESKNSLNKIESRIKSKSKMKENNNRENIEEECEHLSKKSSILNNAFAYNTQIPVNKVHNEEQNYKAFSKKNIMSSNFNLNNITQNISNNNSNFGTNNVTRNNISHTNNTFINNSNSNNTINNTVSTKERLRIHKKKRFENLQVAYYNQFTILAIIPIIPDDNLITYPINVNNYLNNVNNHQSNIIYQGYVFSSESDSQSKQNNSDYSYYEKGFNNNNSNQKEEINVIYGQESNKLNNINISRERFKWKQEEFGKEKKKNNINDTSKENTSCTCRIY